MRSPSAATRLLVVMDPIARIDPQKDSTFAMRLEAQRREWDVRYAELSDIWLRDGEAHGRVAELQVADTPEDWHAPGGTSDAPLGEFDVILMRKDPPFDMEYVLRPTYSSGPRRPGRWW